MSEWATTRLGKVLVQHDPPPAKPQADDDVDFAGVRWYGEGLFVRETRKGSEVSSRCYPLKPGTFVYSRLFAWKQSFAVATDDFDGVLVSNEFLQFDVDSAQATPEYLVLYCSSPLPADELYTRSKGATAQSRNRLEKEELLQLEVQLPPLPIQRAIVRVMAAVDEYAATLDIEKSALIALLHSARQSLLGEAPLVALKTLCSIKSKTVDPKSDEYADLPHIGVAAIEKGTGRLSNYKTAREDGVISNKYLFGPQDVIYAKIRPELRKATFPAFEGLCSADAYPLTPTDGFPPELLREILLEDSFTELMTAVSSRLKMPKVNRKQLFTGLVRVPAEKEERERVVSVLSGIRGQISAVVEEAAKLRLARAALLHDLLTRTIEVSPSAEDQDDPQAA